MSARDIDCSEPTNELFCLRARGNNAQRFRGRGPLKNFPPALLGFAVPATAGSRPSPRPQPWVASGQGGNNHGSLSRATRRALPGPLILPASPCPPHFSSSLLPSLCIYAVPGGEGTRWEIGGCSERCPRGLGTALSPCQPPEASHPLPTPFQPHSHPIPTLFPPPSNPLPTPFPPQTLFPTRGEPGRFSHLLAFLRFLGLQLFK